MTLKNVFIFKTKEHIEKIAAFMLYMCIVYKHLSSACGNVGTK